MARIFKTRVFARLMRKSGVTDAELCDAVGEMKSGLIDADLGRGVVKKRIAIPGRGKRGSARTVVVTNRGDRWFFVYGFKKNDRANITDAELDAFRKIADDLLKQPTRNLDDLARQGELLEICHEKNS